jgi:hypothetical protein
MSDYQNRVVEEKATLDRKIKKLTAYIRNSAYNSLPAKEMVLLADQLSFMCILWTTNWNVQNWRTGDYALQ